MFKTRQIIFLQLDKTLQNIATGIFLNLYFGKIFYFFLFRRDQNILNQLNCLRPIAERRNLMLQTLLKKLYSILNSIVNFKNLPSALRKFLKYRNFTGNRSTLNLFWSLF